MTPIKKYLLLAIACVAVAALTANVVQSPPAKEQPRPVADLVSDQFEMNQKLISANLSLLSTIDSLRATIDKQTVLIKESQQTARESLATARTAIEQRDFVVKEASQPKRLEAVNERGSHNFVYCKRLDAWVNVENGDVVERSNRVASKDAPVERGSPSVLGVPSGVVFAVPLDSNTLGYKQYSR